MNGFQDNSLTLWAVGIIALIVSLFPFRSGLSLILRDEPPEMEEDLMGKGIGRLFIGVLLFIISVFSFLEIWWMSKL